METSKMIINADKWMRGTGLPYWTVAALRNMKVGDELIFLSFTGPGYSPKVQGSVEVSVERLRGCWNFSALWLSLIGRNAKRRGFILVPGTKFKLLPGRKFAIASKQDEHGMLLVRRMLRRSYKLAQWAKASGEHSAARALYPSNFPTRSMHGAAPERMAEAWLSQLS